MPRRHPLIFCLAIRPWGGWGSDPRFVLADGNGQAIRVERQAIRRWSVVAGD